MRFIYLTAISFLIVLSTHGQSNPRPKGTVPLALNECAMQYEMKSYLRAYECFMSHPELSIAYYYAAITAREMNDPVKFDLAASKLIEGKNRTAINMLKYAQLYEKDTAKYIRIINQSIQEFPADRGSFLTRKLNYYVNVQDYGRLIAVANQMETVSGCQSAELYFIRGTAWQHLQNNSACLNDYQIALRYDPDHKRTNYALGMLHYNTAMIYLSEATQSKSVANAQEKEKLVDQECRLAVQFLRNYINLLPPSERGAQLKGDLLETFETLYTHLKMAPELDKLRSMLNE